MGNDLPGQYQRLVRIHHLLTSSVRVRATNLRNQTVSLGGATLISKVLEDHPAFMITLAITNKHVIEGADRVEIGWNALGKDGYAFHSRWLDADLSKVCTHIDGDVDLAAIPADEMSTAIGAERWNYGIYDYSVMTAQGMVANGIAIGSDIRIVSYVDDLSDRANRPVLRSAIISTDPFLWARTPSAQPLEVRYFLIDSSTYGGSSGGGVYALSATQPEGWAQWAFVGVLTASEGDLVRLGHVIPGYRVLELFDQFFYKNRLH